MDVVKYLLTAGLIGSALTDKFDIKSGVFVVIVAIIVYLIAFFTIPTEEEEK
ncbi:MAG: hypothetical protein HY756_08190 [Nitrospirae bacterium]|nr:hypothetical protein [Nitrospirota bacterium]